MDSFIKCKMLEILEDLKNEIDNMGNCCEIKECRFDNGKLPDYSQPIIQQIYLLRYFPAYLAEYYYIYKKIMKQNFIRKPYSILSIGAGCGLDYYGIYLALKEQDKNICDYVYYTGIDCIDWNYRDALENEDCRFVTNDVCGLREFDSTEYNVIIFPKSIGEFDKESFDKIKNIFVNTAFEDENIYLISSLREQNDSTDVSRLGELINIMEETHNYKCLDVKDTYTHFRENAGIRAYISDFIYPNSVYEYLSTLNEQCDTFKTEGSNCYNDCVRLLNRKPILRTDHIKYQIKRLTKGK